MNVEQHLLDLIITFIQSHVLALQLCQLFEVIEAFAE